MLPLDVREKIVKTFNSFRCKTSVSKAFRNSVILSSSNEESNLDSGLNSKKDDLGSQDEFMDVFSSLEQLDWALTSVCLGFLLPLELQEQIRKSAELYIDALYYLKKNKENIVSKPNSDMKNIEKYMLTYFTRLSLLFNSREFFKKDEILHMSKAHQLLGVNKLPTGVLASKKTKKPFSAFWNKDEKHKLNKKLHHKSDLEHSKRKSSGEDFFKGETFENYSSRKHVSEIDFLNVYGQNFEKTDENDFNFANDSKTKSLNESIFKKYIKKINRISKNISTTNGDSQLDTDYMSKNKSKSVFGSKAATKEMIQERDESISYPRKKSLSLIIPRSGYKSEQDSELNPFTNSSDTTSSLEKSSLKFETKTPIKYTNAPVRKKFRLSTDVLESFPKHILLNANLSMFNKESKRISRALKTRSISEIEKAQKHNSLKIDSWSKLLSYNLREDGCSFEIDNYILQAKRESKNSNKHTSVVDKRKDHKIPSSFLNTKKLPNLQPKSMIPQDMLKKTKNSSISSYFTFEVPKDSINTFQLDFNKKDSLITNRSSLSTRASRGSLEKPFMFESRVDDLFEQLTTKYIENSSQSEIKESESNYSTQKIKEITVLWEKHIKLLSEILEFFLNVLQSFGSTWSIDVMVELEVIILQIVDIVLSQNGFDPKRQTWENHYKKVIGTNMWGKTWGKLGDALVKPALKLSVNIWFFSKQNNDKTLNLIFENRLLYWFHRPEVVDLWLQLYGQVILRQLRYDYGELSCVGVSKIKLRSSKFKIGADVPADIVLKMCKFITNLNIEPKRVTTKGYIMYITALSHIVKILTMVGKNEKQIQHFRENNEIILPPPMEYIFNVCKKPILDSLFYNKFKSEKYAKAKMITTDTFCKLLCMKEICEDYNNPKNYNLLVSLEEGFRRDAEMQVLIKESCNLLGSNPNARAYVGQFFRSIQLVLPEPPKNMTLYYSKEKISNWSLKSLLSLIPIIKYYHTIDMVSSISDRSNLQKMFKGDMFGIFRNVSAFTAEQSEAISYIENSILAGQDFFLKSPEFTDMLIEILMVILTTLLSEKNMINFTLLLRVLVIYVAEYSEMIKGSLKAIIDVALKKIEISQNRYEISNQVFLALSHIASVVKFLNLDTDELKYCVSNISKTLSESDTIIYQHRDYSIDHQTFFVQSKCLFNWLSLNINDDKVVLVNSEIGSSIINRLTMFIFDKKKLNPRKAIKSWTLPIQKNLTNKELSENLETQRRSKSFSKQRSEMFVTAGDSIPVDSSYNFGLINKNKAKNRVTFNMKNNYFDKEKSQKSISNSLRNSLKSVVLTMGVSLYSCSDSRDSISKVFLNNRENMKRGELINSKNLYDLGLDVLQSLESLIRRKKCKSKGPTNRTEFFLLNGTLVSLVFMSTDKTKPRLFDCVFLTTRNINGRYTSIINENVDGMLKPNSQYSSKDIKINNSYRVDSPSEDSLSFVSEKSNKNFPEMVNQSNIFSKSTSNNLTVNIFDENTNMNNQIDVKNSESSNEKMFESKEIKGDLEFKNIKKTFKNTLSVEPDLSKSDNLLKVDTNNKDVKSGRALTANTLVEHGDFLNFGNDLPKKNIHEQSNSYCSKLLSYSMDSQKSKKFMENLEVNSKILVTDTDQLASPINKQRSLSVFQRKKTPTVSLSNIYSFDDMSSDKIDYVPWSNSINAERIVMNKSIIKNNFDFPIYQNEILPMSHDVHNTELISQIIKNDFEKRLNQTPESSIKNQFTPLKPTNYKPNKEKKRLIKKVSTLSAVSFRFDFPLKTSPNLLRNIIMLDCLDSAFIMRANILCFNSIYDVISKSSHSLRLKSLIPESLNYILKSFGEKIDSKSQLINYTLSTHIGFRNKDSNNDIVIQLAPNLNINNNKKSFSFESNEKNRYYIDESFEKKRTIDKNFFLKYYTSKDKSGIYDDFSKYHAHYLGCVPIPSDKKELISDTCLFKFLKCVLQDSVTIIYVPSDIEDILIDNFWEKISINYCKLKQKLKTNNKKTNKILFKKTNNKEFSEKDTIDDISSSSDYNTSENISFIKINGNAANDSVHSSPIGSTKETKSLTNNSEKEHDTNVALEKNKLKPNYRFFQTSKLKTSKHALNKKTLIDKNKQKNTCKICTREYNDIFDVIDPVYEPEIDQKPKFSVLICPIRATRGLLYKLRLVITCSSEEIKESLVASTGPLISGMTVTASQLPKLLYTTLIEAKKNLISLEGGNFSTLHMRAQLIEHIKKEHHIKQKNSMAYLQTFLEDLRPLS
ncbi:hypothetical protein BB561_004486 [Smittium simulii]|uniref:Uncharacterized protein n=1 Tax=Smittium simulii TaxID=133385 RepID=A0A2T9YG24_9FUNG|nr:hypothetical protein BB561_004486 [Smittium simulii]